MRTKGKNTEVVVLSDVIGNVADSNVRTKIQTASQ